MKTRRWIAAAAGLAFLGILGARLPRVLHALGENERGRARLAVQALLAAEIGFRADHGRFTADLKGLDPYLAERDFHLSALDTRTLRIAVGDDTVEITARSRHGRWGIRGTPERVTAWPEPPLGRR